MARRIQMYNLASSAHSRIKGLRRMLIQILIHSMPPCIMRQVTRLMGWAKDQ